jgi:tetratricopeptide (TPR) repeat protein
MLIGARLLRRFSLLWALSTAPVLHSGVSAAESPPSIEQRLQAFYEQGKFKEGLDWLKSFGQNTPSERRYRGLFHHGLAQPGPALEHLMPAYRADPKDDLVALALAEASLWKKDYKTALAVVGHLQAPESADALRVRGMIFEQAGRLPDALALYERAIPKLKQPWGTLERKGQVLSWLKRFDDARSTYQKVVESSAASTGIRRRCRVHIAELTAWQKDFTGALAQLGELLKEEPRQVEALLLQGQILEWSGRYPEAKQAYSRILAIDPNHRESRLRLDKLLWVK